MHHKLSSIGAALVIAVTVALVAVPVVGSLQAGAESNRRVGEVENAEVAFGAVPVAQPIVNVQEYDKAVKVDKYLKTLDYLNKLKIAEYIRTHPVQRVSRRSVSRCGGDFECFKRCTTSRESHGNYSVVSSSGTYRGAYQFDQRTWEANGGVGDPAAASPQQQDAVAYSTWQRYGTQPWGGMC